MCAARPNLRTPKLTPITHDYEITPTVLGLGINGKVVECFSKTTDEKFALKVKLEACFVFIYIIFIQLCYI